MDNEEQGSQAAVAKKPECLLHCSYRDETWRQMRLEIRVIIIMMCPVAEYRTVSLCRPGPVLWVALHTKTSILRLVNYELFEALFPRRFCSLCIWSPNRRQTYIMGYVFLTLRVSVPCGRSSCGVFRTMTNL